MPDQDEPTTAPLESPTEPPAEPTRPPLDEGNGLRETYAYFLPPPIAAALRLLSGFLQDARFESEDCWKHLTEPVPIVQLRAIAADLRHLERWLCAVSDEDPDPYEERELVRLCRLAWHLSDRVGKIAAAIEGALA